MIRLLILLLVTFALSNSVMAQEAPEDWLPIIISIGHPISDGT